MAALVGGIRFPDGTDRRPLSGDGIMRMPSDPYRRPVDPQSAGATGSGAARVQKKSASVADALRPVSLDASGRAEGTLYEDAGDGFGYERGEFARTRFVAETRAGVVHVSIAAREGAWATPAARRYRVTLLGAAKGAKVQGP